MGRKLQLTGNRYTRLLVISEGVKRGNNHTWVCQCDCGTRKEILGFNLVNGKTVSCGCERLKRITTHGLSKTKEYQTWRDMIRRCEDKRNKHYSDYGPDNCKWSTFKEQANNRRERRVGF